MALREWAQRQFTLPEGANAVKTVQLTAEGAIWETWHAPFPELETFLTEADNVVRVFAEECPKRRIPILYTAIDQQGGITSQQPGSVMGKNAQADALAGSGNNAAKAFADAMAGITGVMKTVLAAADHMVQTLSTSHEKLANQLHESYEYQRAKQEAELVEQKDNHDLNQYLIEQVKGVLPLAMEAWEISQAEKKKSLASTVVNGVAKAATNTTTGATS